MINGPLFHPFRACQYIGALPQCANPGKQPHGGAGIAEVNRGFDGLKISANACDINRIR